MASHTFTVPDASGAEVVVQTSAFKVPQILRDGELLPREKRGGPFVLALPDGTQRILRVRGTLNLSIDVDDRNYPLERRLSTFEYVFVGLPLVLAIPGFTGGALGFGVAAAGVLVNARLARMEARAPVRLLALVASALGFILLYFVIAVAIYYVNGQ
jgi:hypothetical protein